jgi:hypothetical protein
MEKENVKLSDALSEMQLKEDFAAYDYSECLLGQAYEYATGKKANHFSAIAEYWPWLKEVITPPDRFRHFSLGESFISAYGFAVKRGEVTKQDAVDWLRTIGK